MVSEIVHGIAIDPGLQGQPWSTERANVLMVAAKRAVPLAEFTASFPRVVRMLEGLTDDQLAAELQRQGIQVTRRTVAKYREDMQIPSTHQRRVR